MATQKKHGSGGGGPFTFMRSRGSVRKDLKRRDRITWREPAKKCAGPFLSGPELNESSKESRWSRGRCLELCEGAFRIYQKCVET